MFSKPGSGRGTGSVSASIRVRSGATIDRLADESEGTTRRVNRFGMSEAQISIRDENVGEAADEPFARRLIEIDHDVATEHDVELAAHRPRMHEIQRAKGDE